MTINEFKQVLNMFLSKDIETVKLADGIIQMEFPQYLSYKDWLAKERNYYFGSYDSYYWIIPYTAYLREHICPFIVYSPYQEQFI